MENTPEKQEDKEGLPSIFKNWNQLYAFVLAELVLLIVLFTLFTYLFS